MHVNAHLDVDLVALEQADEVTVLLELTAPDADGGAPRPPATVQVVLDRSGSMGGGRLEAAKTALCALVERLDAGDRFGLVAFDDVVDVVVPTGPLTDRRAVQRAIALLQPGGSTNLSGGLLRGVQEARRAASGRRATLLLLSDGRANHGVTDPAQLAAAAAAAQRAGVATATIGLGLGYDEHLLSEIARGGGGNHVFAAAVDEAMPAVAGEVEGLLSCTAQAASLLVRPAAPVQTVALMNDLPAVAVEGGVMIELGDLWASETRKLLLRLGVPALGAHGLARIATLELRYVALPALQEERIDLPLHVNVVPGDQAAGRVPDPKVRTELTFLEVQEAKRRAAEHMRRGDQEAVQEILRDARRAIAAAPPSGDLGAEEEALRDLERLSAVDGIRASKVAFREHHHRSRKRGREE